MQKTTKDLYKLLGLPRGASQEDIRKAHRELVRKYHPDANPKNPQAEERFKEIQQAYEVLSNPAKRREYDNRLNTSSRESFGRPHPRRAARRAGEGTTYTIDLSDLLGKLVNISRERVGRQKEGSFQLQGEEVAYLAKLLGEEMSRISERLSGDTARISKLLGDNIKANARVGFEDARSSGFSSIDEDMAGEKSSGVGNKPREKRVKGPRAQGREKRVKGPRARRKGKSD